uniref:Uncharacterized protein n=1 Tax=Sphaerodactylus townsendi TaxID=933632 RepID=A0ACB8F5V7_9SAUR
MLLVELKSPQSKKMLLVINWASCFPSRMDSVACYKPGTYPQVATQGQSQQLLHTCSSTTQEVFLFQLIIWRILSLFLQLENIITQSDSFVTANGLKTVLVSLPLRLCSM